MRSLGIENARHGAIVARLRPPLQVAFLEDIVDRTVKSACGRRPQARTA
jgi:hypothetical protein